MWRSVFGGGDGDAPGGGGGGGGGAPPPAPATGGGGGSSGSGRRSGGGGGSSAASAATSFDPTGLERAAKAARELERNPNAGAVLNLAREQELAKQAEQSAKRAEYEAYAKQLELQRVEKAGEEQRRTMEKQAELNQSTELYRDKLTRERGKDDLRMRLGAEQQLKEQQRQKDEESVARQEAMRRKTAEYETALRQQAEIAKARAEAEGRIEQQRRNHDLDMEKSRMELTEKRKTVLETVSTATSSIGSGLSSFFADEKKMAGFVVTVGAAALGIYTARTATTVTGNYIAARLGKPSLIRETSRLSLGDVSRHPLRSLRRLASRAPGAQTALDGVVLEPHTESRLRAIASATANARTYNAPYRNVLLHGPPGTGKTLFAKRLARSSGLEYAIFTGGDVAPLAADGVSALHKLFDWAETSRKGLLLFIDEADALLRTRSSAAQGEHMRNALNAFLFRTGAPSERFMVVYASNRPQELDDAANDRIDDIVTFALPSAPERAAMIQQYVRLYLTRARVPVQLEGTTLSAEATMATGAGTTAGTTTGAAAAAAADATAAEPGAAAAGSGAADDVAVEARGEWPAVWARVVAETEGFSGREMAKLVIGWQAAAYGAQRSAVTAGRPMLTAATAVSVLQAHHTQKQLKEAWHDQRERAEAAAPGSSGVVGTSGGGGGAVAAQPA